MPVNAGDDIDAADIAEGLNGWINYTPTVWQQMSGSRVVIAGRTVNHAKYMKRGRLVIYHFDIAIPVVTGGGFGIQLPFNAQERILVVGSGGVFGSSPPAGQSWTVSLGPGTPVDNVICTLPNNQFLDISAANQVVRGTAIYEPAA